MRVKKIASVLMAIILLMSIAGCSSPKKETAKQVKSESKE
ncbi:heme ABC transporter substrate-binding protein IsdE, partial [Klebsiella pneumoniae]|nr:heme ABC transporter substrate-binding protein IsdE [Klebsiella pneumoniae]